MELKMCMYKDMEIDEDHGLTTILMGNEEWDERAILLGQYDQDNFYDRVYRPLKLETELPQEFKKFHGVEEYRAAGYMPIESIVGLPESVKRYMLIPDALYICKTQPYYIHRKRIEDGDESYFSYLYNEYDEELITTELYHKDQLKVLHKAFSDHFEYISLLDENNESPFVEFKYFPIKSTMDVKVPIFVHGYQARMLRTYLYSIIL